MQIRKLSSGLKRAYAGSDVQRRMRRFNGWMDRADGDQGGRNGYDHQETVREYYDLSNEFMVSEWGESLHFAPLSVGESLEESQLRHQRLMISKLELSQEMTVIDVGCGIGGPLRRVVRETGVKVVGINTSEVQLNKAKAFDAEAGFDGMVDYVQCSFMDMSTIDDNTFDRGYAIESTCHAPDKVGAFTEIHRVLKPGALLWGQEMCMTDKYDPDDLQHRDIKRELMQGIALKEIAATDEVNRALEAAGFEIVEARDRGIVADSSSLPWYRPLVTRHGTMGNAIRRVPLGRKAYIKAAKLAELARFFPKGTADVAEMLDRTAAAYVAGGETGIFTPLYCFLARKPL